jgi:DNA repair protein SbcD/Mre11
VSFKLVFATDLHFRATKPISRLDNDFFGSLLAKVDELRELSADADIVLLGGDIFDRPDVPHSVVIKVIRAFSKFKCPIYTVVGNHDVHGYQEVSVEASALGVMFENGVMNKLDILNPCRGIAIYGLHAYNENRWRVPNTNDFKVLVAHKMITGVPIPNCDTILPSDVARETNANLILCGDIHTPFIEKHNGKTFVNPGSFARMSINDRERQPQAAVITIEDDGEVNIDLKTLCTRPAESVFDIKAYSQRMAQETHTKDFIRTYVQAIISVKAEADQVGTVLVKFLEDNGVEPKMRKTIEGYLLRAQKEVLKEIEE